MPAGIAITFPTSPVQGQTYLAQNGFTYIYDSQKNRWDRGGEFVRAPKVLTFAGVAATTTGSGITTDPFGSLIYNIPGVVIPSSSVGVESYKAYRYTDSWPNYTEVQVSISSAFSTIAYAATSTSTTFSIPAGTLSGNTTYYVRARQFVGSSAASAGVGAISGYSQNSVRFITTSVYLDAPTIVSIKADTDFPAYEVGFGSSILPSTITYTGSGVGNLDKVEWRVTGPRIPSSTGDTALAEVGVGTFSSSTLANALVLAMPFSGASGVGITNDVNAAIRTASGASAGTTKTVTANGGISTSSIAGLALTAHFYPSAAYFDGSNDFLAITPRTDFEPTGNTPFTFECWIYPTAYADRTIFGTYFNTGSTGAGGERGFLMYLNSSGTITVYMRDSYSTGNVIPTTTTSIPLNTWTHLAIQIGAQTDIYFNGLLQSMSVSYFNSTSADGTRNPITSYHASAVTYLGANIGTGTTTSFFTGYLQDVKIYNGLRKYRENFTPPLPTYGTISYTTGTTNVGVSTTAFYESTGDLPTAEVSIGSSTAAQVASSLVLAMPMNRTFGFQDINVAVRGLTSGASAGTAKTVGLGTTSTANAPSQPMISSTESKWYDGAGYFDGGDYGSILYNSDFNFGTGNFTFEMWVNPDNISGIDGLYATSGGSGANPKFVIHLDAGVPKVHFNNLTNGSNIYTNATSAISAKTWTHLAYTRSGSTWYWFINGALSGTGSNSTDITFTSQPTYVGYGGESYFTEFNGYLQDLKIYKGFAKYTANFAPPQPICGFTTDISTQTGFTTTTASGALLSSVVGLGSTSTLAFDATQNYAGVTSITSSSGITTLPDPYAQNLVLALPLANITGVGNSFTNDRNTQIRTASITGAGVTAGTTKTITNTNVGIASTNKFYGGSGDFTGTSTEKKLIVSNSGSDFNMGTGDFTIEWWGYYSASATSNAYIIDVVPPGQTFAIYRTTSNTIRLYSSSAGVDSVIMPANSFPFNQWVHFAVSRGSGIINAYVNGILVQSTNYAGSVGAGQNLEIGSYATDTVSTYNYDGYMQDLKVYKGLGKYTTNFTPPPPMFGDYTRSTPNKLIYTPSSDYVLEARNTSGITTSNYSATRQWGTKPKGGIYDPYASKLVLAIPGGAVGGATTTFDVTGQIRYETPTASYVNAGIVTYSNSLGIGTYGNKSITNTSVTTSTVQNKFYGRSLLFGGTNYLNTVYSTDFTFDSDFTMEFWVYFSALPSTITYGMKLLSVGDGNTSGWNFTADTTNKLTLGIYGWSSGNISGNTALTTATWYHIACVRKSDVITFYVNGVIDTSATKSGTTGNSGNTGLYVGTYSGTGSPGSNQHSLNGYIQDLKIYKGIAKYTSNFTPPTQIYLT